ncbi:MAG: hybrid sensor histidine kinase/response regulator [Opitutaceae bacterium]
MALAAAAWANPPPRAIAADLPPFAKATSVSGIWNVSKHEAGPIPFSVELTVYYYDPLWHVLWGSSDGAVFFLPVSGHTLPLETGERVRLSGDIVFAAGLDGDRVHETVLDRDALPEPVVPNPNAKNQIPWLNHWARIDGYVRSQTEPDANHVIYRVLAHDRLITAHMRLDRGAPIRQLVGAKVRVDGVYVPAIDPAGRLRAADLWVPGGRYCRVEGRLDEDPRFALPLTPIAQLSSLPAGMPVRIAGRVQAREPGRSVSLRDADGQVTIASEDPAAMEPGDYLEAAGLRSGNGIGVTLRDVVFRELREVRPDLMPRTGIGRLRLAAEIMTLRPEDAAHGYPVSLRGLVIWSDPHASFFYFEDSSGAVAVRLPLRYGAAPAPGKLVSISGRSAYGAFAPEVALKTMQGLGWSVLPHPERITLEQAMTGSEEAHYVEISGYVERVQTDGSWTRLDLVEDTGEFSAYAKADPGLSNLVGARVRVIGVCAALANDRHELTGVRLWLPSPDCVQVEEKPPADPFVAPNRTIASLRQFMGFHAFDQRVKIRGVVVAVSPGRYFCLQQGDAGLLVLCRDPRALKAGSWVDVVGLPGHDGSRLVLREAIWRRLNFAGPAPAALAIADPARLRTSADERLVRLRAQVAEAMAYRDGSRLVLRSGSALFDGLLAGRRPKHLPAIGSVVDLTGVYALQYDAYHKPSAFSVLLPDASDIRLVEAPPWWTAGRALAAAWGLGLCVLFGVAWVAMLRIRVARQTRLIRRQLAEEGRLRAELERVERLESVGLLAGGIAHDFNNLLTVVVANLGLAAMGDRLDPAARRLIADAERGAMRAAEITEQLLTFSKGGDPVRAAVDLPEVVRESAEFASHGSNVRHEFAFAPDLRPADIDRVQIGRVVHNLVLNAAQAMPEGGTIRISLANTVVADGEIPTLSPGRYLKLTIADEGKGVAPDQLSRIFEPYFTTKHRNHGLGLATVHSIVVKHQGRISVDSEPGRGTSFAIWLPAAAVPADAPSAAKPAGSARGLRLLFMDDEEPIRRVAGTLLRRLGHDAILVGDGADAVREYRAARTAGRPYDIVVLDLTVPGGMGGRAAMEELRRLDPGVRAIVSSGYSSDPIMAHFEEFGFSAMVSKPYNVRELAEAIQEVAARQPAAG